MAGAARAQDASSLPALTVFAGAGPDAVAAAGPVGQGELGARVLLDVGAVVPLGAGGTGLVGAGRARWGGIAGPEVGAWVGLRTHFGQDALRTFADFALATRLTPGFTLGPRVGFGAQLELTPALTLFGAAGVELALLGGLRADLELSFGAAVLFDLVQG
ncbi:MAG: hypothetical protein L0Y66_07380 [Myxococcaceae bacterium]|nr:hypothetical protein [Myxococcaceae bacterium]MCI0670533.1 hypothetical protein [Myxococcaceae bacterium]